MIAQAARAHCFTHRLPTRQARPRAAASLAFSWPRRGSGLASDRLADRVARILTLAASAYLFIRIGMGLLPA